MYTTAKLVKIENNQTVTKEEYADFFYEFQHGVLLSLKDNGKLTMIQYRYAENVLKKQRIAALRNRIADGDAI